VSVLKGLGGEDFTVNRPSTGGVSGAKVMSAGGLNKRKSRREYGTTATFSAGFDRMYAVANHYVDRHKLNCWLHFAFYRTDCLDLLADQISGCSLSMRPLVVFWLFISADGGLGILGI